jgi:hypothetical protein
MLDHGSAIFFGSTVKPLHVGVRRPGTLAREAGLRSGRDRFSAR